MLHKYRHTGLVEGERRGPGRSRGVLFPPFLSLLRQLQHAPTRGQATRAILFSFFFAERRCQYSSSLAQPLFSSSRAWIFVSALDDLPFFRTLCCTRSTSCLHTPSSKFLKSISNPKLLREAASRVAQLRLMHIPLNSYLTQIQKVDSARCPVCRVDEENIEHYLLRCPSYAHERWPLVQLASKKRKPLTLRTLLGDPSFVLPLAAYTHVTERFKQLGE